MSSLIAAREVTCGAPLAARFGTQQGRHHPDRPARSQHQTPRGQGGRRAWWPTSEHGPVGSLVRVHREPGSPQASCPTLTITQQREAGHRELGRAGGGESGGSSGAVRERVRLPSSIGLRAVLLAAEKANWALGPGELSPGLGSTVMGAISQSSGGWGPCLTYRGAS